jgi:hypothetical protein
VTVNSTATLLAALAACKAGDVIDVFPGDYTGLRLAGVRPVVPTGVDPWTKVKLMAQGASLGPFVMENCSSIQFSGFDLDAAGAPATAPAWRVWGCTNVGFSGCHFHGDETVDPQTAPEGVSCLNSASLSFSLCEFDYLYRGIAAGATNGTASDVLIERNYLHDMARTALYLANLTNPMIRWNFMTSGHALPTDHRDAIALFDGNYAPSTDVHLHGNVAFRGSGASTQGIGQAGYDDAHSVDRVTVTNNLVVGEGTNSLTVGHAAHVLMMRNEVYGLPDIKAAAETWYSTHISAIDNIVEVPSFYYHSTDVFESGTVTVSPITDQQAVFDQWKARHPADAAMLYPGAHI